MFNKLKFKILDYEENKKFESVYSTRVRAGKRRTYFFDVRETKGGDYYITLTESTRNFEDGGYNRHKIFLYKEDFNRFEKGLSDAINHVKTELMPDFDYEEYERRQEEWEKQKAEELANGESEVKADSVVEDKVETSEEKLAEGEEDMTW